MAEVDPGFGGLSILHEAILRGSVAAVTSLVSWPSSALSERNFLGQTPLHLAVSELEILKVLLQAGHDVDAVDKEGRTPLMYAAAMGHTKVVQLLIRKGANILLDDNSLDNWNFIGCASIRGHWDLIVDSLEPIQSCCETELFKRCVEYSIVCLVCNDETGLGDTRRAYFAKLIKLCIDVNFTFKDPTCFTTYNTLLHYISHYDEADTLVRCGFTRYNQLNSEGQHAIHLLPSYTLVDLTGFLIDHGTDVNAVDKNGRTVLFYLLPELSHSYDERIPTIINCIHTCLAHGLDILASDNCRCACAPDGCCVAATFNLQTLGYLYPDFHRVIWVLELLCIIEEVQGCEPSKKLLMSILRKTHFERLGITHVCCNRGSGLYYATTDAEPLDTIVINEILEEESESITMLEKEVQKLEAEPLGKLRYRWICMLQEIYQTDKLRLKKMKTYEIDHKNDAWRGIPDIVRYESQRIVLGSMKRYAKWLKGEYARWKEPVNADAEADAWYAKRVSWFRELMQAMEVEIDGI
ncbi:ankyrin repeat-containing domain protein [Aspergillus cavernicola]|uniref:Ankyrin repeat-containing domain protein n=1 Tax=Aspergillus cavernicola TaxID=176166 RepID=A0ABR4IRV7_9EURO